MKTILTILLTTIVQLSFAQTGVAADTLKIEASKIQPKTVYGKYIYQTNHGYTVLQIRRTKHFKERGLLYFGWTINYGKWKIQNDTLLFFEKSYRTKPYSKRTENDRVTELVMVNGALFLFYKGNGTTDSRKYITKKQWRKDRRARKRRRNEQYDRLKKSGEIK